MHSAHRNRAGLDSGVKWVEDYLLGGGVPRNHHIVWNQQKFQQHKYSIKNVQRGICGEKLLAGILHYNTRNLG